LANINQSLFSATAEFDLEETALDVAVKDLKVGNMMRKLTVIRSLPETLRNEGEVVIDRLLPVIQVRSQKNYCLTMNV
jgi:hypothetical protein